MKNILSSAVLCLIVCQMQAQKIIEKHIDFSQKKSVSLNIQIADSIRIITWNKNEVYVKASVNINDNKDNEVFKMTFDQSADDIDVDARFVMDRNTNCCSYSKNDCCNCNCKSEIFCEVYIPENVDFSAESISGNIIISGKTARIRAHSISGFIDLAVSPGRPADVKMNTISGRMYSDFEFQSDARMRRNGGNSIQTQVNGGGGQPIDIETISGDIYFRKAQ